MWAMSSFPWTGIGHLSDLVDDAPDALVEAALDQHRVGASGDVPEALVHDRLGEHGRGRRAVAGDVVGLGRGFLEKLRAHVLERVLQLDVLGDRDAVVGDGRGAPLLVEGDVPALRAEGGLDGVGEGVDARLSETRASSRNCSCLGIDSLS